jgi:endonuclease/exonuclease/phosphatase family metal-dependent hydrolase
MRFATYNVENLFQRARALNLETWDDGKEVLEHHATLNGILNKPKYSAADKKRIVALMEKLGIAKKDDGGSFVVLRQNRGKLIKRPTAGGIEVVANGRGDWVGWLDLKVEEVDEAATRNTAQVIRDVNADVLGVVEAETRPALVRFSEQVMPAVDGTPYARIMLIDGNDERGIDVGIMMKEDVELLRMRSHVDDEDDEGRIFSRDCAEFTIKTARGNDVVVLINHFKSKGFGSQADSNERRERQARRVKEIYDELVAEGMANVVVLGDLNDTPESEPLAPLLQQTDLKDVAQHADFKNDPTRPGTFGSGTKSNKIDYILLSPPLFDRVSDGEIFRKGVWAGTRGDIFEHYAEITRPSEAASDHSAVWCEVEI